MGSLRKVVSIFILVLALLSETILIHPVLASLIFSDGFESGDFSAWSSYGGNIEVSTLMPKTGLYSARLYASYGGGFGLCKKQFGEVNPCSAVHFAKFSAIPDPTHTVTYVSSFLVTYLNTALSTLKVQTDSGVLRWAVGVLGTTTQINTTATVTTGVWYNLTEQIYVHSSQGYYTLFIDGERVFNVTGISNTGVGYCSQFMLRIISYDGTGTIVRYEDDVRVGQYFSDILPPPTPNQVTFFCTGDPVNTPFTLNGTNYATPQNITKDEGTFQFTTPDKIIVSETTYNFMYWLVNSTEYHTTTFTLSFNGNTTIVIYRIQQGAPNYILRGAYNEEGFRDGAINITCYRSDESPFAFSLDGEYNLSVTERPITFQFIITAASNETRTYYIISDFETIYVFKPADYYLQYYFTLVDYIPVSDAYLESLLNINGTDRVVERWLAKTANEMPFTMSWGTTYKMRLVCNKGTAYLKPFTAGATQTYTYIITPDLFPVPTNGTGGITVYATRQNATWVQAYYNDADNYTTSITMEIHRVGFTGAIYTVAVSDNTLSLNWYDGNINEDYWVNVTISHEMRGYLYWYLACGYERPAENPWSLLDTVLGTDSFPIAPSQFIGMAIVMAIYLVFSEKNWAIGLVVSVIFAALLVFIGWLSIGWGAIAMGLGMAIIIVLSVQKDKQMELEM